MNFKLLSAIAAVSVFGYASAEEAAKPYSFSSSAPVSDSTAVCTRQLEGIVYQPETAARLYYDRISEQIKVAGPVLWSDQADSFIESFELKYGVTVTILDPFRNIVYPQLIGKSMSAANNDVIPKYYSSATSTANMNASGYYLDSDADQRTVYEFIVYNPYGELKYVVLSMPLANSPDFKK